MALPDPSILLIPSGYKANVVYSELDNTSNSDFTFARASIANRYNENSLVEEMATGVPRLDYLDGSCPALLLEPQSTNIFLRSEQIGGTSWTNALTTQNADAITAPDGQTTSDEIVVTASAGFHSTRQYKSTFTNGTDYTFSIFAKRGTSTPYIRLYSFSSYASFNLDTQVITNEVSLVGSGIKDYGNGWYRCHITFTTTNTFANSYVYIQNSSNAGNYTGVDESVYLWGAQMEQSSYPTSYIKTEGSTVTRLADECNNAGISALINSEEGVLYCEIAALADNATSRDISITDGTLSNYIVIKYYNFGSNRMNVQIAVGGVTQVNAATTTIPDITQYLKVAFKYKQNDFSFWVDGVELLTDNSGITFPISTLNNLSFDVAGFDKYFGKVRDIRVYKTALSDVELTALTT
jgi:hypothetical protein